MLRAMALVGMAVTLGCADDPSPGVTAFGEGEGSGTSATDTDTETDGETGVETDTTTSTTTTPSTSTTATAGDAECGNGVIDAGEQCDGVDLNDFDCASLGYAGGTLGCDSMMCIFDTSMCTTDTGGSTSG